MSKSIRYLDYFLRTTHNELAIPVGMRDGSVVWKKIPLIGFSFAEKFFVWKPGQTFDESRIEKKYRNQLIDSFYDPSDFLQVESIRLRKLEAHLKQKKASQAQFNELQKAIDNFTKESSTLRDYAGKLNAANWCKQIARRVGIMKMPPMATNAMP